MKSYKLIQLYKHTVQLAVTQIHKFQMLQIARRYCHLILPSSFPGAMLGLLWCFMLYVYSDFISEYTVSLLYQWKIASPMLIRTALGSHYIISPLFPLVGMIADIWTGRYRVIVVSIHCCFIGWLVVAISYFTVQTVSIAVVFLIAGIAFQLIGQAGFHSNTLAFIVDQAIGASGNQLSSMIYWYSISYSLVLWILSALKCLTSDWNLIGGVCLVVSGAAIVIIISSLHLFKHTLDTTPQISNPIKLILKVLNYARKNKYPENRSALTYYLDEAPSRIDLGKHKYGGPFNEEQVEDVKTVLRLLPLFVCTFGLAHAFEVIAYAKYLTAEIRETLQGKEHDYLQCLQDTKGVFNLSSFLYLLTFQMVIRPCFYRCIPTMLKRIQLGLVFCLLGIISYVSIDVGVSVKGVYNSTDCFLNSNLHHTTTGIDYHWELLPDIMNGIGFAMGLSTMLELTVAQAPGRMRGLMVGTCYGIVGTAMICAFLLYKPATSVHPLYH